VFELSIEQRLDVSYSEPLYDLIGPVFPSASRDAGDPSGSNISTHLQMNKTESRHSSKDSCYSIAIARIDKIPRSAHILPPLNYSICVTMTWPLKVLPLILQHTRPPTQPSRPSSSFVASSHFTVCDGTQKPVYDFKFG
jgi:hypothetical protein